MSTPTPTTTAMITSTPPTIKPATPPLPSPSRVAEFFLCISKTSGYDKLAKLLQFSSRFTTWYMGNDCKATQTHLNSIFSGLGLTRKMLRLFRSIDYLRDFYAKHKEQSPANRHQIEFICAQLTRLSLASYCFFDHFMLAIRLGIWKPTPRMQSVFNALTEGSWGISILATIVSSLHRLHSLNSLQTLASFDSAQVIAAERWKAVRALIASFVDLPVCLFLLNLTGKWPEGHFSLLAITSSLLSFYEMWPSSSTCMPTPLPPAMSPPLLLTASMSNSLSTGLSSSTVSAEESSSSSVSWTGVLGRLVRGAFFW
eukprot:TRINITY_DN1207_c0_g1_i1.p1 TRINITY_DN1207_c0_g1~~TRINITY_DN1207_c0_g1_i1.p1  ORF type:complete len:313 (-),score=84.59 TRINITY_DN1207_c0_g1_i1:902-1840(-)